VERQIKIERDLRERCGRNPLHKHQRDDIKNQLKILVKMQGKCGPTPDNGCTRHQDGKVDFMPSSPSHKLDRGACLESCSMLMRMFKKKVSKINWQEHFSGLGIC
jgi:hypothetical protein